MFHLSRAPAENEFRRVRAGLVISFARAEICVPLSSCNCGESKFDISFRRALSNCIARVVAAVVAFISFLIFT